MSAALHRLGAFLGLILLTACATTVPPPVGVTTAADPQAAWSDVLQRRVDDRGRVDFQGLAADRVNLDRYVDWVYRTSPASDPALFPTADDRMAYYLNSYNALAMYNVLETDIPETLEGLRKVPFFFLRKVQVGGQPMTLYAYENDIIRPLGEERVHFALNCMAAGCPRLPQVPYAADQIEAQLDAGAREFFSEDRNLQVDDAARVVRVSEILRFYTEDFLAKEPSLVRYLNRYRDPDIPEDYKVEFIKYDWRINNQPQNLRVAAR